MCMPRLHAANFRHCGPFLLRSLPLTDAPCFSLRLPPAPCRRARQSGSTGAMRPCLPAWLLSATRASSVTRASSGGIRLEGVGCKAKAGPLSCHIRINKHIYIYTHAYNMCVCICIHIYICINVHVHVYIYINIPQIYITYIYIYI